MASELLVISFCSVEKSSAVSKVKDSLGLLDLRGLTMVLSNTHVEVLVECIPVNWIVRLWKV
jgi:hypothetical protein